MGKKAKKIRMARSAQVPSKLAVVKKEGAERSFVQDKSAYLFHRSSTNEVNKFRMCVSSQAHSIRLIKSREIPHLSLLTRDSYLPGAVCGLPWQVAHNTRKIFSRKSTETLRQREEWECILVGRDRICVAHDLRARKEEASWASAS